MAQSRVTASHVGYFYPRGGASKEYQRSVSPAAAHSPDPQVHPEKGGAILSLLGTGRQSEAPWTKRNARSTPDPHHAVLHSVDLSPGQAQRHPLANQTLHPQFRIPQMPPSVVMGESIYVAIIRCSTSPSSRFARDQRAGFELSGDPQTGGHRCPLRGGHRRPLNSAPRRC